MNIFVGNLSSQATEKQLENLFTQFGEIKSVKIITDNYTHRSKGFAFVEMPEQLNAEKAIEKLNNSALHGQSITVNEARPRNNSERFGKRSY
jgi:RNA recognition motif-containing protein